MGTCDNVERQLSGRGLRSKEVDGTDRISANSTNSRSTGDGTRIRIQSDAIGEGGLNSETAESVDNGSGRNGIKKSIATEGLDVVKEIASIASKDSCVSFKLAETTLATDTTTSNLKFVLVVRLGVASKREVLDHRSCSKSDALLDVQSIPSGTVIGTIECPV